MNDLEVRVRCVEAAARVPGNPNTIQQARAFYEFVTEGQTRAVTDRGNYEDRVTPETTTKKTSRK
jgi:hypothetical protein